MTGDENILQVLPVDEALVIPQLDQAMRFMDDVDDQTSYFLDVYDDGEQFYVNPDGKKTLQFSWVFQEHKKDISGDLSGF